MSTAHEVCCFKKRLFSFSNSDAGLVYFDIVQITNNLFLCIRINSQKPIQQYMGELIDRYHLRC